MIDKKAVHTNVTVLFLYFQKLYLQGMVICLRATGSHWIHLKRMSSRPFGWVYPTDRHYIPYRSSEALALMRNVHQEACSYRMHVSDIFATCKGAETELTRSGQHSIL